ncbi:MAG: hypothetical protein ACP5OA_00680 [Candidatus Woesearchaeota archaeon]
MNTYQYADIQSAYREALLKASDKIGLDPNRKEFFKKYDSIDLEIIYDEIDKMVDAGSDVAKICHQNFFGSVITNIKGLLFPDYKRIREEKIENIKSYAQDITPKLIHLYSGRRITPEYQSLVPLDPHTVLDDLYNAFHQGLVTTCNGKSKPYSEVFSTERVIKEPSKK